MSSSPKKISRRALGVDRRRRPRHSLAVAGVLAGVTVMYATSLLIAV